MPNAMKLQGRVRRSPTPQLLRSPQRRSRGQAMVEFALVVPVFLVVLCGILYFGFMLYSKMSIINAAREGAHYGIILDPRDAAFAAKVSGQVSAAAGAGLDPSSVTTATTGFKVVNNVVTGTSCTWGSGGTCVGREADVPGDAVTVTVTYPFANPIPLRLVLLGNVIIDLPRSFTLSSTVQMIHE